MKRIHYMDTAAIAMGYLLFVLMTNAILWRLFVLN